MIEFENIRYVKLGRKRYARLSAERGGKEGGFRKVHQTGAEVRLRLEKRKWGGSRTGGANLAKRPGHLVLGERGPGGTRKVELFHPHAGRLDKTGRKVLRLDSTLNLPFLTRKKRRKITPVAM